jgi:hypothetical protein
VYFVPEVVGVFLYVFVRRHSKFVSIDILR